MGQDLYEASIEKCFYNETEGSLGSLTRSKLSASAQDSPRFALAALLELAAGRPSQHSRGL